MKAYPGCEVCEQLKNPDADLVVFEDPYWLVQVRTNYQTTLGTCLVILKRHVSELDQLTPGEDSAFISARNRLIRAQRKAFNPITFNVSCLKNNAFSKNPDKTPSEKGHVHWHFKPRYSTESIVFEGETFTDPQPGQYDKQLEHRKVTAEFGAKIASAIRTQLD